MERTHHADCWRDHHDCAVQILERLAGAAGEDVWEITADLVAYRRELAAQRDAAQEEGARLLAALDRAGRK